MSEAGAYGDPVGTIRRENHPAHVEVHRNDHEGSGYSLWVLVGGPVGAPRVWMRVESTNWDYGFALSFADADTWSEIVGVVPGSEADRQQAAKGES